jgi:hypothetical protein
VDREYVSGISIIETVKLLITISQNAIAPPLKLLIIICHNEYEKYTTDPTKKN